MSLGLVGSPRGGQAGRDLPWVPNLPASPAWGTSVERELCREDAVRERH